MSMNSRNTAKPNLAREDGASMILLALVLVVLMGFAAIAVDAAAAWALRRQGQSGADTGAVAGALFTAERTKAQAMQDAEEEIIRITFSTIEPPISFADWQAEWAACVDSTKPPEFTDNHSSPCISFTANLDKVRVRTPDVPWRTTFARVIGFNEVNTHAIAEVNTYYRATGGVMPFGMPGQAADDVEICLKTGANPQGGGTCDGPATGNFGFIDFSQYGNDALGTTTQCTGGGTDRLELNISRGVDHPLGKTSDPAAPLRNDLTGCNDGNFNYRAYNVDTQTGNIAQALDDGFADGTGGLPGRLAQGPAADKVAVRGHQLNDTPLWEHLNVVGHALCAPYTDGTMDTHDELVDCLEANFVAGSWTAGVIFEEDIIEEPRFGWVPLFHEPTLGSGSTNLTIKDFRPVYIQTTLWGCNAGGCDLYWDPAEGVTPGPNNVRIEASTAINLPKEMLPDKVKDTEPGTDNAVVYLLSE